MVISETGILRSSLLVGSSSATSTPTTTSYTVVFYILCLVSISDETAFSTWRERSFLHDDCHLGFLEVLSEIGLGSEVHRMKMKKPVLI